MKPIKYLRDKVHKVTSKAKTIHEKIKLVDVNKLDEYEQGNHVNPYTALKVWFIDYVVVLGTLTTIPYITFINITSINQVPNSKWFLGILPLAFGCIWWLSEQAVKRYTEQRKSL